MSEITMVLLSVIAAVLGDVVFGLGFHDIEFSIYAIITIFLIVLFALHILEGFLETFLFDIKSDEWRKAKFACGRIRGSIFFPLFAEKKSSKELAEKKSRKELADDEHMQDFK